MAAESDCLLTYSKTFLPHLLGTSSEVSKINTKFKGNYKLNRINNKVGKLSNLVLYLFTYLKLTWKCVTPLPPGLPTKAKLNNKNCYSRRRSTEEKKKKLW